MSTQTETSDKQMLDIIRRRGAVTISALVAEMGVTATAVRQRIQRLTTEGLIERQTERRGAGGRIIAIRSLKRASNRRATTLPTWLSVLWEEIKAVEDPADSPRAFEADRRAIRGTVSRRHCTGRRSMNG